MVDLAARQRRGISRGEGGEPAVRSASEKRCRREASACKRERLAWSTRGRNAAAAGPRQADSPLLEISWRGAAAPPHPYPCPERPPDKISL